VKTARLSNLKYAAAPLALGLALISTPSFAQTADAPEAEEATDNAIVVTGSRIVRRDLTSSSPLAVVSSEEFKLSGQVNVEAVLNSLPQVIPGATAFSNNPGGGVATLNLRGLGSQRNLVLVNGRRWMFYDTSQVVDLNTIPQFLIDSVDIVTGGASAVYGSDAIAGVVNFRLRDVQGVEVGAHYGLTAKGDGARFDTNIAIGAQSPDGRGKVTAFANYSKRKPIFQGARDFSEFGLGDDGDGGLTPLGSGTIPAGRFTVGQTSIVNGVTLNRGLGTVFGNALLGGGLFGDPGVAARPYIGAGVGNDSYNYAPVNFLQVPQERWLIGAYGEYEISDALTAYTELTFVNNRVDNQLAASPLTGAFQVAIAPLVGVLNAADIAQLRTIDANEAAINAARIANGQTPLFGTAVVPDGIVTGNINKRLLEVGPRAALDERNAFRALIGAKGTISEDWSYDASYFYARTRNSQVQNGNVSRSLFQAGLLNGTVNPFGNGSLTQAAVDSFSITTQNSDISELQVATAAVSGTPFNLGWGGEDVGIAVGAEWRSVASSFLPDTALSSGDVIGFNGGDPTSGGYSVKEVFGELRVPVIADKPGFHRLDLNAAARYSDYSLPAVGAVFTWTAGAEWAPIQDITFRGQYQKAVRAPNVGELFAGQAQGFPAATDPCALPSAATDATIRALCIATGVPAASVGSPGIQANAQIEGLFGGNPDLQEEKSTSYTFGTVIRPSFIPKLNITVDYYNIKVNNVISAAGGGVNNILDLCYNTIQNAADPICQLINRNSDGAIESPFVVQATNANLANLAVSGVDAQIDYSIPLGFGLAGDASTLKLGFLGTYTLSNDTTPLSSLPDDVIECAGKFGLNCGDPTAKYKWSARMSYIDGPLTASFSWNHLSSVRDDDDDTDFSVEKLGAYDNFDLSFSLDVNDNLNLTAGVNNLFDKRPPIIGDNQEQANTYPGTYDVLGRDLFVAVGFRF
jgi:iron complex outermembrane recepter protein